MIQFIKSLLRKSKYIRDLSDERAQKHGAFPPGHYNSPIPNQDEVLAYLNSRKPRELDLPDVDLRGADEAALLHDYRRFYGELPFPEKRTQGCRYYYDNVWYSYADAIFLYSFLRKNLPRRIIEIGSGFSSAVMLDTIEKFFPFRPEITFIEPRPDRLNELLTPQDRGLVRIVEKSIQEVPLEYFSTLESGDLLFIDSSHVVKCGSDLHVLMFDVLPYLPAGIYVHFHDVFYPFDYPPEWLKKGRYYNENYFLRSFLSYNQDWSVYFFNAYVAFAHGDVIARDMPLCARNPGGSLYLRRNAKSR